MGETLKNQKGKKMAKYKFTKSKRKELEKSFKMVDGMIDSAKLMATDPNDPIVDRLIEYQKENLKMSIDLVNLLDSYSGTKIK